MINKYGYKGKIIIKDLVTGKVTIFENVVTYGFYVKASRLITGTSVNPITHIGFGTGDSVPSASDTILQVEVYRTTVDSSSVDSSTGEIEIICDIAGGEASFIWREIGLFDASSGGVMTNRASTNYDHTTGNDVRVTYVISKV